MLAAEDTFFSFLPSFTCYLTDEGECCAKGNTAEKRLTSFLSKVMKVFQGDFQLVTSCLKDNHYFLFKNVFSVAHWE